MSEDKVPYTVETTVSDGENPGDPVLRHLHAILAEPEIPPPWWRSSYWEVSRGGRGNEVSLIVRYDLGEWGLGFIIRGSKGTRMFDIAMTLGPFELAAQWVWWNREG